MPGMQAEGWPDITITDAHPVTEAIIKAVIAHAPLDGWVNWYVDDTCIDCNAEEFWNVVDAAVRAHMAGIAGIVTRMQELIAQEEKNGGS